MTEPNLSAKGLEARAISCERDDRVLIDGLSFHLNPGQVLLLEGANGTGKTTFLRILCGLRQPDAGEIYWQGREIAESGFEYLADLAYLGHHNGIKLHLTPEENLRVVRDMNAPAEVSIQDALSRVGLYGFEDVPAYGLSAGQKRRLALARFLVARAPLWVMDEPLTSLDRTGVALLLELIHSQVTDGGMVVLTSHHELNLMKMDTVRVRLGL